MTDDDIDRRLAALFAADEAEPDPAFAARVVALARVERDARQERRRMLGAVARETIGLAVVLATFAALARVPTSHPVGFGDTLPPGSPAFLGVGLLALWLSATARVSRRA